MHSKVLHIHYNTLRYLGLVTGVTDVFINKVPPLLSFGLYLQKQQDPPNQGRLARSLVNPGVKDLARSCVKVVTGNFTHL